MGCESPSTASTCPCTPENSSQARPVGFSSASVEEVKLSLQRKNYKIEQNASDNSMGVSLFEKKDNSDSRIGRVYLCTWFTLNVIITLYCKAVFSIHKFPYPMIMTTIHLLFTAVGVQACAWLGLFEPKPITRQQWKPVLWFSVIFTLNIWMSNASLMAVSVNLHQVIRTTIPLFTMAISWAFFSENYSWRLFPPVCVVILGVAATVWGDLDMDTFGMTIVVLGCFLSALKGILTQKTQVGSLGMSSMDLLRYLSPLAVLQLVFLAFTLGEVKRLQADPNISKSLILHLILLGCVAFGLNFVSFRNAAYNNPLTLNIAGNVKQVLTSILSMWLFGGVLGPALAFGITATALGAFWYNVEGQKLKMAKAELRRANEESAVNLRIISDADNEHSEVDVEKHAPEDYPDYEMNEKGERVKTTTKATNSFFGPALYALLPSSTSTKIAYSAKQFWKGNERVL